ncbi:hypothetical protein VCX22_14585 [Aeromonas caviae]|uniref:hypothetical protein n=1 Tax=Aeromonas caviae TaxID=648 RepID=UPI002B2457DC|nr:hypothetical protein [Aeromonas caviae]MEA9418680.1 hypothetical protein [Aeromonas caviae]
MAAYSPPFTLTHAMLSRVVEIAELVGQWRSTQSSQVPMLRRENRIRTIQASLAIEHNTLSLEQVTAVIDGKPVLGLPREIQEVRNAFAVSIHRNSIDTGKMRRSSLDPTFLLA